MKGIAVELKRSSERKNYAHKNSGAFTVESGKNAGSSSILKDTG